MIKIIYGGKGKRYVGHVQTATREWCRLRGAEDDTDVPRARNECMTLSEKILFHQVHPAKLATDVAAAVISFYFLWRHQLVIGLLTHFIPPPTGSAVVICAANLDHYKNSNLGGYLARYMTPMAQATRLAGDLITVVAAWYQSLAGIVFGLAIILAAWTYGLLARSR